MRRIEACCMIALWRTRMLSRRDSGCGRAAPFMMESRLNTLKISFCYVRLG